MLASRHREWKSIRGRGHPGQRMTVVKPIKGMVGLEICGVRVRAGWLGERVALGGDDALGYTGTIDQLPFTGVVCDAGLLTHSCSSSWALTTGIFFLIGMADASTTSAGSAAALSDSDGAGDSARSPPAPRSSATWSSSLAM